MPEFDIFNPEFWRKRIQDSPPDNPQFSVYHTHREDWEAIEQRHIEILSEVIGDKDSILDAACGWGRLLSMLPPAWDGEYLGVDLSPDFIRKAKLTYPHRAHSFLVGDLRQPTDHLLSAPYSFPGERLDWAVVISVRPMVVKHCGHQSWELIESQIRKVAKKILYLEYSKKDQGSIE